MDWLVSALLSPLTNLNSPDINIYWVYLLGAVIIARVFDPKNWRSLFDRKVWTSAVVRVDLQFYVVNSIVFGWASGYFFDHTYATSWWALSWAQHLLGGSGSARLASAAVMNISITMAYVIGHDLGYFIGHLALHKIPLLWRFHKVHHSTTVLTPLSGFRSHAFDDIVILVGAGAGAAAALFLASIVLPMTGQTITIGGVHAVFFIFNRSKALRHSDNRLSFGPWLDRVFSSPLQHQVHHSDKLQHHDKNFGLIFSFWDGLFGTLYLAQPEEDLTYGIGKESAEYGTVVSLYLRPFQRQKIVPPPASTAGVPVVAAELYGAEPDPDAPIARQWPNAS